MQHSLTSSHLTIVAVLQGMTPCLQGKSCPLWGDHTCVIQPRHGKTFCVNPVQGLLRQQRLFCQKTTCTPILSTRARSKRTKPQSLPWRDGMHNPAQVVQKKKRSPHGLPQLHLGASALDVKDESSHPSSGNRTATAARHSIDHNNFTHSLEVQPPSVHASATLGKLAVQLENVGRSLVAFPAFNGFWQGQHAVVHAAMVGYAAGSVTVILGVLITQGLRPFLGLLHGWHAMWVLCSSRQVTFALM